MVLQNTYLSNLLYIINTLEYCINKIFQKLISIEIWLVLAFTKLHILISYKVLECVLLLKTIFFRDL